MREDNGYGVACGLEVLYEGMDIGRGLVGGRAIVVHDLLGISSVDICLQAESCRYKNMHSDVVEVVEVKGMLCFWR